MGRVKGTERRKQRASSVTQEQTLGLHELQEAKGLWKLCTSSPRAHTHTRTPPSGTALQLALSHNLYRPFLPDPPDLHPQVEAALPTLAFLLGHALNTPGSGQVFCKASAYDCLGSLADTLHSQVPQPRTQVQRAGSGHIFIEEMNHVLLMSLWMRT